MIKIPKVELLPMCELKIHAVACKNCPSLHGTDPEDIMRLAKADQVKTAFPCGWRPTRYCDSLGIKIDEIKKSDL